MIKANELRLGNWVEHSYSCNLMQISDGGEIDNQEDFGLFNPIPLTHEWLERAGFSFDDSWLYFSLKLNDGEFILNDKNGDGEFILCDIDLKVGIRHVHQLQNLFFALTGEELTIKE